MRKRLVPALWTGVLITILSLPGVFLIAAPAIEAEAGTIQTISPAAARTGQSVTITGNGFGAFNVRVTVGGVPAQVVSANGARVTFVVPDGVKPGVTQVVATNPGSQSGSIAFRMLEGFLLPGPPGSLLTGANFDLLGHGADADQIENGIFLTRIEVRFRPDATVAQVNSLLQQINGGIIDMSRGLTFLTIAVPRQDSIPAISALVALADAMPGVSFALLAQTGQENQILIAPGDVSTELVHLLPGRFPAAWNAVPPIFGTDLQGLCPVTPVPLLIADNFSANPPATFSSAMPSVLLPASFPTGADQHGYDTALVAAGSTFGANPFITLNCLDVRLVQLAGQNGQLGIDNLAAALPTGLTDGNKFIVNLSQGFIGRCPGTPDTPGTPCVPPQDILTPSLTRGALSLYWKEKSKSRWSDFLIVASAGNNNHTDSSAIYAGMADARFNSFATISQLADTLFNFVNADAWNPSPTFANNGFTSLLPTATQFSQMQDAIRNDGVAGSDSIADNVIVVGSTTSQSATSALTQHVTNDQLAQSFFSSDGADVLAVGEDIFGQEELTGTSFAAPQVAGLASYLWMLSPDLESKPASVTKQAIVANARNHIVDAYASVLSLDAAASPNPQNAPVRLTLLDVTGDARQFDEFDIDLFLRHYFVVAPDGTITHQAQPGTTADFSRYDLNGDGFTTAGARRERFDLDRVGSTQYGQTNYSTVSQTIEGQEVRFDETGVTDLEILCYYAYSDMFQGNPDARKSLLAGRCGIGVDPPSATIKSGQQQQFTATSPDNATVTWSVAPTACGTIDQTSGLFTANGAGTCTVTATDSTDPDQAGTATIVVTAATNGLVLSKSISIDASQNAPNFETVATSEMSADVLFHNTGLDCVSEGTDVTCRTPDFAIPLLSTVSPAQSQVIVKTSEDSVLTTGGTITGQMACGATPQNGTTNRGSWSLGIEIVVPAGQQATLTLHGSVTVAGNLIPGDSAASIALTGPQNLIPTTYVTSPGVTPLTGGPFTLGHGEWDLQISGNCAGGLSWSQARTLTLTFTVN